MIIITNINDKGGKQLQNKMTKAITVILFILYFIYYFLISIWINIFHSTIHIISICGLFVPLLLFILLMNRILKTSYPNKKKYIIIVAIIALIPVLTTFGKLIVNENESYFSIENWIEEKEKRVWMVDDLINNYNLKGMNKKDIIELLGEPAEISYFKKPDNIVYYLGPERGLISIDSEWLVIWFNQNDVVEKFKIMGD